MDNTAERFAGQSYGSMLILTAIIHKDEDRYVIECSEVGTASQGRTIEEAAANLREAPRALSG